MALMEKYRIDPRKGLEFGLYTLGDHLPNPATGERISAAQRIEEIIELAKLAEDVGIDFFSVGRVIRNILRHKLTPLFWRQSPKRLRRSR